jgi:hypothetical protein
MRQLLTASLYILFSLTVTLLLQTQAAEVSCWAPDGTTIAPNDSFVPCNKLGITQKGIFSSCCQLDGDAASRDLCASSGLCVNGGVVRREYCTDKSWSSPTCVKICTDPAVSRPDPTQDHRLHATTIKDEALRTCLEDFGYLS